MRQLQRGQWFPVVAALAVAALAMSCSSSKSSPPANASLGDRVPAPPTATNAQPAEPLVMNVGPAPSSMEGAAPGSTPETPGPIELIPSPPAPGTGTMVGTVPEGSGRPPPVPSAGCGFAPPESGRFEIEVGGQTREYILRMPDDYDSGRAYPLVFALHWLGGNAQQVAGNFSGRYYGLADVAGDQVVLVSPEGLPSTIGGGGNLGWDNPGGRDTELMRSIFARFSAELCIDESRVFSTGFSYGGMMSFALACGAADMVRAIAPMAGTFLSGCEDGDSPVAIFGFIGQQDNLLQGSRTARDEILSRSGCSDESEVVESSWCDEAGAGAQPCTCVSYQGCAAGFPATWCEFTGGHQIAPNSGPTLWNFFSQF
jgi:polyhydroxybutyrate depolymerase